MLEGLTAYMQVDIKEKCISSFTYLSRTEDFY